MDERITALLADLDDLAADSDQTAQDALSSGNRGQAAYEAGRRDAYQYAIHRLRAILSAEA